MTSKELIALRLKLVADQRAILDKAENEKRALLADERESLRKLEADERDAKAKIDTLASEAEEEREIRASVAAKEREMSESRGRRTESQVFDGGAPSDADRDLAFRGWCMGRHATEAQRAAAQRLGFNIDVPMIDMAVRSRMVDGKMVQAVVPVRVNQRGDILEVLGEQRALSIGTTTAGGNSVANELPRAFYEVQKWYGRVRELAQIIQTETGATLPYPTVTDTANTGAILAEATTATTNVDPTFGVVNLGAFKFSSKAVIVSWELLQDSFIDLPQFLGQALGRRVGRIQNNKFTAGAGTTEPMGFVTAATTVAAAATNAITFDEIITLVHAVDPAYRSLPDTAFQVHDTIAAAIRKLKDGNQRYLWELSTQVGMPDRLLGYPVHINNDMAAALTTGLKVLAFGNMKLAYVIRDAGAVRFVRSDEKYILEHQVVFEASQRSDGNLLDSTAMKVLTLA